MTQKLYSLSVRQPWLWAITDLDKRVENRKWKPPRWILGARIALHASKTLDHAGVMKVQEISGQDVPLPLPMGTIVATAVIHGVVGQFDGRRNKWFFGPYGWVLADVQKLPEPVPCNGALGLWRVPDDIVKQIKETTTNV